MATLPKISDAELVVMNILWDDSPLSAREVHDGITDRPWAYSTTRTVLERLRAKGMVSRERSHGIHLYTAAIGRAEGLAAQVLHVARNVLGVDWKQVVSQFGDGRLTPKERRELARLLRESD